MSVAKSFQDFPIVSEIFEENGREYIKVQNPKTGTIRKVRWYQQLSKVENNILIHGDISKYDKPWSSILGFEKENYVLIFQGLKYTGDKYTGNEKYSDFLQTSPARFNTILGWYILPTDIDNLILPAGLALSLLKEEDIFVSSDELFDEAVRRKNIAMRLKDKFDF